MQWKDHYSLSDSWSNADFSETRSYLLCQSVGFLVHETKESLFLSLSCCVKRDNTWDCSDTIAVLKSCIKKKIILGYSEKEAK